MKFIVWTIILWWSQESWKDLQRIFSDDKSFDSIELFNLAELKVEDHREFAAIFSEWKFN